MLFKCFKKFFLISWLVIPDLLAQPTLWNIPIETSKFIGRDRLVKTMKAKIKIHPILLTGLSGIGKTSLAYHYIRMYNSNYDIAWKFDAAKNMEVQIIEFAKRLVAVDSMARKPNYSNSEECLEFVKELLRKTTYRWILVFDDARSYSDIIKFLPETHGSPSKQIIITSLTTRSQEQVMRVIKFTPEETIEFLRHHLGKDVDEAHCIALGKVLDYHPFALRQAVSFVRFTPGSNISDYITYYQSKSQEFWDAERAALANDNFRHNQPDLYTSIKIALDKLRDDNPIAHQLLCALSQINFSQIDGDFIKCWVDNFADGRPDVFGHLLDRALVSQVEVSDTASGYTIHNYTQAVIINVASDVEIIKSRQTVEKLLFSMLDGTPEIVFEYFENNPIHANHLEAFCGGQHDIQTEESLDLNVKILYYAFYAQRRYEFTSAQVSKISKNLAKKTFSDSLMVASFYNLNSYMRYLSYGLSEAIVEALKAYEILRNIDSNEARNELIMLLSNNLGFYYYWRGDLDSAERCCKEAIEILSDDDDPKMIVPVQIFKFVILADKGKFKAAESIISYIKSISENDSFLKRVTGHFQKTLHAMILLKQNKNEEARELAKSAYEDAIEASEGDEKLEIVGRPCPHWSIAESRLGCFVEAERIARIAINIFDETYRSPRKNRQQANSHFALAIALQGQQKYEDALAEFMLAKKIYSTLFVQLRIDDVSDLYFKIVELGILLKDDLLVQEHMQQHIEIFGLDHPRSVEMSRITAKV